MLQFRVRYPYPDKSKIGMLITPTSYRLDGNGDWYIESEEYVPMTWDYNHIEKVYTEPEYTKTVNAFEAMKQCEEHLASLLKDAMAITDLEHMQDRQVEIIQCLQFIASNTHHLLYR